MADFEMELVIVDEAGKKIASLDISSEEEVQVVPSDSLVDVTTDDEGVGVHKLMLIEQED